MTQPTLHSLPSRNQKLNPTYTLSQKHLEEWTIGSAVDEDLTRLNVESISGDRVYSFLYQNLGSEARRNDGRLRDTYLKRYSEVSQSGWLCRGVDILSGTPSDWGCFKPDTPRLDAKKGKPIKYEHPAKMDTGIFCLRMPDHLWEKIAARQGVPIPGHGTPSENKKIYTEGVPNSPYEFWQWVLNTPSVPLLITEGAKKAAALLSHGYPAIALPGIFNGYRTPKLLGEVVGLPFLIPQLAIFCQEGREIIFCFDQDDPVKKPKTVENVGKAIEKTGKLLSQRGCTVSVVQWDPKKGKGVDDLMVSQGVEYFDFCYQERITLDEYKIQQWQNLDPYVDLVIHEKYFNALESIPFDRKIIGLKGLHGTGKSHLVSEIAKGRKTLSVTHREQLSRKNAQDLNIPYRADIMPSDKHYLETGYSLCIDSLHPNANPKFNPYQWENAVLHLAEIEQLLHHILNSDTCSKNRVIILENLKELIRVVYNSPQGLIIVDDADLSPKSLDFITKVCGYSPSRFVVENTYSPNKEQGRKAIFYNSPDILINTAIEAIKRGERIIIHTDGQKNKSNWGTQNLERTIIEKLRDILPDIKNKILRVDRDTVTDITHPAYQCIDNINEVFSLYQVIICSPVLETGVSIDGVHIDHVFTISHGVQSVGGVVQSMQRYRGDATRHLWVKSFSRNRIGNGATDIKQLLGGTKQLSRIKQKVFDKLTSDIHKSDLSDSDFYENGGPSPCMELWGKQAVITNSESINFGSEVRKKVAEIGYTVSEYQSSDSEIIAGKLLKDQLKEIRDNAYDNECLEISQAPVIDSHAELERLKSKEKQGLATKAEKHSIKKTIIANSYDTDNVTPDLIKDHDNGLYPKLRMLYYLTIGQSYLAKREQKTVEKLKEQGEKLFVPDFNRKTIGDKIETLKILGVERFLNPDSEFSIESEGEWYQKLLNPQTKYQLRTVLGIAPSEKDNPISFIQKLLKKTIGLTLNFDRKERLNDGKRLRIYKGINLDDYPIYQGILNRWLERDSQAEMIAEGRESMSA